MRAAEINFLVLLFWIRTTLETKQAVIFLKPKFLEIRTDLHFAYFWLENRFKWEWALKFSISANLDIRYSKSIDKEKRYEGR